VPQGPMDYEVESDKNMHLRADKPPL